jgi:hypothetical protein
MLAATLIEVFVIPVSFDVVEKLSHRVKRRSKSPEKQPAGEEGAPA